MKNEFMDLAARPHPANKKFDYSAWRSKSISHGLIYQTEEKVDGTKYYKQHAAMGSGENSAELSDLLIYAEEKALFTDESLRAIEWEIAEMLSVPVKDVRRAFDGQEAEMILHYLMLAPDAFPPQKPLSNIAAWSFFFSGAALTASSSFSTWIYSGHSSQAFHNNPLLTIGLMFGGVATIASALFTAGYGYDMLKDYPIDQKYLKDVRSQIKNYINNAAANYSRLHAGDARPTQDMLDRQAVLDEYDKAMQKMLDERRQQVQEAYESSRKISLETSLTNAPLMARRDFIKVHGDDTTFKFGTKLPWQVRMAHRLGFNRAAATPESINHELAVIEAEMATTGLDNLRAMSKRAEAAAVNEDHRPKIAA